MDLHDRLGLRHERGGTLCTYNVCQYMGLYEVVRTMVYNWQEFCGLGLTQKNSPNVIQIN